MPSARAKASLPVLFGVVIVDLIGFGIVMPILPFYAETYGASATTLGLLLMVWALAQTLFAPVWGRLSDRFGRRTVLLLTIAGNGASLLLLGLAQSLEGIFLARALAGVFAANVSVASAYIADVTEQTDRTRWMGMLGASFGIGFILGPAIGGGLAPWGHQTPMLAAAALAAVNLVFAALALREPERHEAPRAGPSRSEVLRDPRVRTLCLSNFAFSTAVTQLETIFAFFMLHRFGYDAQQVAFLFVGIALVMAAIQGGGMRSLSRRYPERTLAISGALLLGASFVVMPQVHSVGLLLVPLAVSAAGRAVVQPSLLSLTSVAATPQTRGVVMGTFQSSASVARVVGPVAAGMLYDVNVAGPFLLGGALLAVVAWLSRGLDPVHLGARS